VRVCGVCVYVWCVYVCVSKQRETERLTNGGLRTIQTKSLLSTCECWQSVRVRVCVCTYEYVRDRNEIQCVTHVYTHAHTHTHTQTHSHTHTC